MRIYVVCDLEGTAGVVDHRQQCWFEGAAYYPQARRLATLELNALVEGALEGGATEIWAWDGHGDFPGGLDVELLHPECKLVINSGGGGPAGLDGSHGAFDGLFMCGLHGMTGAERGVLAHSFATHIRNVWINDIRLGEIGMNMLTAGLVGVPTAFLAGDRAAAEEVRALAPEVVTAVVKEGLLGGPAPHVLKPGVPALSLAPEKARSLIRERSREAVVKLRRGVESGLVPYRIEPPYVFRVEYLEAKHAENTAQIPGVRRVNETTIEKDGQSLGDFVL